MRTLFRALRITAIAALILMLALFAMLLGARAVLRPAPGDWSTTVRTGPIKLEVGVAALIQWGTTPGLRSSCMATPCPPAWVMCM